MELNLVQLPRSKNPSINYSPRAKVNYIFCNVSVKAKTLKCIRGLFAGIWFFTNPGSKVRAWDNGIEPQAHWILPSIYNGKWILRTKYKYKSIHLRLRWKDYQHACALLPGTELWSWVGKNTKSLYYLALRNATNNLGLTSSIHSKLTLLNCLLMCGILNTLLFDSKGPGVQSIYKYSLIQR